jgi:hypothetical protein
MAAAEAEVTFAFECFASSGHQYSHRWVKVWRLFFALPGLKGIAKKLCHHFYLPKRRFLSNRFDSLWRMSRS